MRFRAFMFLPAILIAARCEIAPASSAPADVRTIETSEITPMPIEPPPTVVETEAAPKPKNPFIDQMELRRMAAADHAKMVELPFAPAIAMDPVDGDKVSIRADTPVADYKNRLYYFSSVANKNTFLANPDQYLKGPFSKY